MRVRTDESERATARRPRRPRTTPSGAASARQAHAIPPLQVTSVLMIGRFEARGACDLAACDIEMYVE
jgi:hypothetical protein